jgi:hypothetical protein
MSGCISVLSHIRVHTGMRRAMQQPLTTHSAASALQSTSNVTNNSTWHACQPKTIRNKATSFESLRLKNQAAPSQQTLLHVHSFYTRSRFLHTRYHASTCFFIKSNRQCLKPSERLLGNLIKEACSPVPPRQATPGMATVISTIK